MSAAARFELNQFAHATDFGAAACASEKGGSGSI
jgi:hypothetical protein